MRRFVPLLLAFVVFFTQQALSQQEEGTKLLDKLISEEKFEQAKEELNSQIAFYKSQNRFDSLSSYPYYVGKISLELSQKQNAIADVNLFIKNFEEKTSDPIYLQDLYGEVAAFYQSLGQHEEELQFHEKALKKALSINGKPAIRIGKGYYNVGTGELRRGNISKAIENYKKSLFYYESDPASTPEDLYFANSSMGTSMYYSSKIDSAIYYYEKSVASISKSKNSPINQYYRPALIVNNIAGLYSLQGKTQEGLDAMLRCIEYNQKFIASNGPEMKIADAKRSHYLYIDNLAGIYETLGDYHKSLNLLTYSYTQKKKNFSKDNPDIFKSEVLLGNAHLHLLNFQEAEEFFKKGIAFIDSLKGDFYDWYASAHYGLARVYEKTNQLVLAAKYYEDSFIYLTLASGEYYDPNFLNFFEDASKFYASINEKDRALKYATAAYDYILKHQGEKTLQAFQQTLNLSEVYLQIGETEKALQYSTAALQRFQNRNFQAENALDSIQVEYYKPEAIFIEAKSKYLTASEKSEVFLKDLLDELSEAITILNRRKQFVSSYENVQALINENNRLYDFSKKLNVELFEKTQDKKYLNNLISLHETSLYNRIRSRLNSQNNLSVANVPLTILNEERKLKEDVSQSLSEKGIDAYLQALSAWDQFKNSLQSTYPKYYNLRYAEPDVNLANIVGQIPKNSTVIRYLFVDENLYALVLDAAEQQLIRLKNEDLSALITAINEPSFSVEAIAPPLNKLYNMLWKPLEDNITTQKVIVIPDGELYNLSFDMLTEEKITSFNDFATQSLLANYTISYNISLLLLEKKERDFDDVYVAFAPEFSSKMKEEYSEKTRDSITFDPSYLLLLPQPFSVDLAKKYASIFKGDMFLNAEASKHNFINKAKGHAIIHIGTHAESNNISPELSRLYFAKTADEKSTEDNYLYAYEIYNTDLSSSLAILTACETGKPSFEAGEGMISLAHAFTYAGSESILTSLWKIDEKSSTEIIDFFYENLENGMEKDEALRQAKLTYLSHAQNRTLSPQYWAGLVLMGDTGVLPLKSSNLNWLWICGLIVLIFVVLFIFIRKNKLSV